MSKKYWYKIETRENDGSYHHLGSSEFSIEELISQIESGRFVRLSDLVYRDSGVIRNWSEWDKTLKPMRYINPKDVMSVMEFKSDPRDTPDRAVKPIK